jgi:hypothetical protein
VKKQRVPNSSPLVLDYFTTLGSDHQTAEESTNGWYWLNDLLESAQILMVLALVKNLKAISYAKVKKHKVDAQSLAILFRLNLISTVHKICPEL